MVELFRYIEHSSFVCATAEGKSIHVGRFYQSSGPFSIKFKTHKRILKESIIRAFDK